MKLDSYEALKQIYNKYDLRMPEVKLKDMTITLTSDLKHKMQEIEEMLLDKSAIGKWVTTEESYFPRIKAQHEKWVAQHQLWIYWFDFLNNEKDILKDSQDGDVFGMMANEFERRFQDVLTTDLTTRYDETCESYADFVGTFRVI